MLAALILLPTLLLALPASAQNTTRNYNTTSPTNSTSNTTTPNPTYPLTTDGQCQTNGRMCLVNGTSPCCRYALPSPPLPSPIPRFFLNNQKQQQRLLRHRPRLLRPHGLPTRLRQMHKQQRHARPPALQLGPHRRHQPALRRQVRLRQQRRRVRAGRGRGRVCRVWGLCVWAVL